MISNWAKCIKLKLVILDWVSKQFSDTSFPVGSADRWSMLSFLLEENNYQEDKAVLFCIRKKYDTYTYNTVSVSPRHRSPAQFCMQFLANGHYVCSILEMTGPARVTLCRHWLCLPMNMHCFFIHVDGSLVFPSRVSLKVLRLSKSFPVFLL